MPTPSAQTYGSNKGGSAGRVGLERLSLESMASRGLWPTPSASLGTHGGLVTPTKARAGGTLKEGSKTHAGTSLTDAIVRVRHVYHSHHPNPPPLQTLWPTPMARNGDPRRGMPSQVAGQRRLDKGKRNLEDAIAAQGTPVGSLNPTWVEWLQGFPLEWTVVERESAGVQAELRAAETARTVSDASATPSSGNKRRSPSKP